MEGGSEAEKMKPPEGDTKSKRKMKTASQLEILEKTYAGLFLVSVFFFKFFLVG